MNSNIILSGLVGLLSYFVLSAGNNKGEIKDEQKIKQKGGDQCTDINSTYHNYPNCFEICESAKKIFDTLQVIDKCGNTEYHDLAKLYSSIFCLEMSLGNNNLKMIEEQKVEKELERIVKKYENMNEIKALQKYLSDLFKESIELMDRLGSSPELLEMAKEIKESHSETIIKLYKEFRKID
jgi:uncharacterized coiled-coil DUF342 family protein